jgi:prepilin-type processing-associated H-X9-DG protein
LIGMSYQTKISPMQPFYDAANVLQTPISSAETVIGADATPSNTNSSTPVRGTFHVQGGWGYEEHQPSHVASGGFPEGGNVLYMDGHVVFRLFGEMQQRTSTFPYWWF